jgi:hypothetical protein
MLTEDWSTGFGKWITSESSAGAVENQIGSDLIPGDEPVLARFGTAHDGPSAVTEADTHPRPFAVALDRESPLTRSASAFRTFQEQSPECSPFTWRGSEDLRHGDLIKVDCAATWRC